MPCAALQAAQDLVLHGDRSVRQADLLGLKGDVAPFQLAQLLPAQAQIPGQADDRFGQVSLFPLQDPEQGLLVRALESICTHKNTSFMGMNEAVTSGWQNVLMLYANRA